MHFSGMISHPSFPEAPGSAGASGTGQQLGQWGSMVCRMRPRVGCHCLGARQELGLLEAGGALMGFDSKSQNLV